MKFNPIKGIENKTKIVNTFNNKPSGTKYQPETGNDTGLKSANGSNHYRID
jgi:hypothetical protein